MASPLWPNAENPREPGKVGVLCKDAEMLDDVERNDPPDVWNEAGMVPVPVAAITAASA